MKQTFIILISALLVYTIIPTLIIRLFGIGVYKRGTGEQPIALTFDDGPDPEFTPLLLDLLKKYNIKGTFFVLGRKAEKYPDLIQRMHNEGHLVGIHNYVHWSNALMSPKRVREQVNKTANVINRIIGEKAFYYRPPWGVINLFDFFLMKQFRMILWSVIVGDWKSSGGKQKIKQRLLSKLRGGAVIVLHDSGQTFGADRDAPAYMLEALNEFIIEALYTGYCFQRVDEKRVA
ncbi:polysaccharide deacetylase [Paenibacillus peoriae]|uniref:polysaccharide deacetylase family protein n=1 Tax=Paenibacillus peoriae TaxID=59893 RepID=UPI0006A749EB|nr:polysaccharide deacetylase family protein [Paenibacillus peoriae]ALA44018.1 polysaccharide deacetylase [Paenibacillus peoriae]